MGVSLPDKPVIAHDDDAAPAAVLMSPLRTRNRRMMRVLEQVVLAFNRAGIPVMAMKGAALHLTLYRGLDDRPMDDLDLLIHPENLPAARAVLEELGAVAGEPLVRPDFCPRFYYEVEYAIGRIYPVKIDLHVRPFRPLRYARTLPVDALWHRAHSITIGEAVVLVPSIEDMLVHLVAHSAIHGNGRSKWLRDIRLWIAHFSDSINWTRFLGTVRAWRLALPVRCGLTAAGADAGSACPEHVLRELGSMHVSLIDRLALWQAPRDAAHPATHVLVNLLTTPGWRFRLAYLHAVALPSHEHLADSYRSRHWGWRQAAIVSRGIKPVISRLAKSPGPEARKSA